MAVATQCTVPGTVADGSRSAPPSERPSPSELASAFMQSIDRVASEARRYADSLDDSCEQAATRIVTLRDRIESLVAHPALGGHPTCWGSSPTASDSYDGGCPRAATHEPIGLCDTHHGEILGADA